MMQLTQQLAQHIGVSQACQQLGVPRSTLYRAQQAKPAAKPRPTPARALSPEERTEIDQLLNSERFQNDAPRQVYAKLLDDDPIYVCHWRTMYRILPQYQQVGERRNQLQQPPNRSC